MTKEVEVKETTTTKRFDHYCDHCGKLINSTKQLFDNSIDMVDGKMYCPECFDRLFSTNEPTKHYHFECDMDIVDGDLDFEALKSAVDHHIETLINTDEWNLIKGISGAKLVKEDK